MKHVRLQTVGYIRENTPFTTILNCVWIIFLWSACIINTDIWISELQIHS
jgi:hypothetical protein